MNKFKWNRLYICNGKFKKTLLKCNFSSAHGCECKHARKKFSLQANVGFFSANVGRLPSVVRERLHNTSVSFSGWLLSTQKNMITAKIWFYYGHSSTKTAVLDDLLMKIVTKPLKLFDWILWKTWLEPPDSEISYISVAYFLLLITEFLKPLLNHNNN